MSWQTVFEGDLLSIRRSRLGLGIAVALIAITAGFAVIAALVVGTIGSSDLTLEALLYATALVASLLLPFIAMLGSYSAIVHEREHGSIRFLLGLPNSRVEAYVGKLLSRSVLFVVPTVAGLAIVGVVGFSLLSEPDAAELAAISGLVLLYGLVFTSFGTSISAIVRNETGASVGIIVTWMLFRLGWPALQWVALYMTEGRNFSRPYPEWYYWLGRINPMNAFNKLTYEALSVPPRSGRVLITNPPPTVSTVATSTEFALFTLVGWLVIAPLIGFVRFRDSDLL